MRKDIGIVIRELISLPGKEKMKMCVKAAVLFGAIAYLFYDSFLGMIVGLICLYPYLKGEIRRYKGLVLERDEQRFKELLLSVVAAMKAGYSVENSFGEAYKDLKFRFGDKDEMVKRLLSVTRQLTNNIPIEKLMEDMADEIGSDEIRDFSDIFRIAKRTGGNMTGIMEHSASVISRRMEMKEEIAMAVAAKKYEQQIMNVVPMGIIFYIRVTNPGYLESLYHNLAGVMIMSVALLLYGAAYLLSEKILSMAT